MRSTRPKQDLDQRVTASGRVLRFPVLKGRIEKRLRAIDEWLIREAIAEAEANTDTFAAGQFRNIPITREGMPPADRETCNDYLFSPGFRLPMMRCLWDLKPLADQRRP